MNKKILIVVAAVLVVGAAIFGLTNKKDTTPSNSANQNQQATNKSATTPVASNSVSIKDFSFLASDIKVKKGTAVTWTNNDSTTHTVTEADSQTGPDSSNLVPGAKFTFTFNTVGTFHYKCSIHPDMLGTVTVTQ